MNTLHSLDLVHTIHTLNRSYCASIEEGRPYWPLVSRPQYEKVSYVVSCVFATVITGAYIVCSFLTGTYRHVDLTACWNIIRVVSDKVLLGSAMRITTIVLTILAAGQSLCFSVGDSVAIAQQVMQRHSWRVLDVLKQEGIYVKTLCTGFAGSLGAIIVPELLFTSWGINMLQFFDTGLVYLATEAVALHDPRVAAQQVLRLLHGGLQGVQLRSLFARIQALQPLPIWYDNTLKVEFLAQAFRNYDENRDMIETLLLQMDDEALKTFYNKTHKTLLIAAFTHHCSEAIQNRLLQKTFLYMQKEAGEYAFKYVVERYLQNPHVQALLRTIGLIEIIPVAPSYEIDGTVEAKVLFWCLTGTPERITNLVRQISTSEKIALIENIDRTYGRELGFDLVSHVMEVNHAHMRRDVGQINIPESDPQTNIQELASLYTTFVPNWKNDVHSNLQTIANNIAGNVQIQGAPANRLEREVYYKPIKNAACGVLHYFKMQIERLSESQEHKSLQQLVEEQNGRAKELANTMKSFFEECQEAAGFCIPRLSSTIINEYQRIVLGQVEGASLEVKILKALVLQRDVIAKRHLGQDGQSVHLYNAFIRDYGVQFGIPGAGVIAAQNDIYAPQNDATELQAVAFISDYRRECVGAVEPIFNENKELVTDFLKEHVPLNWVKEEKERIVARVQSIWNEEAVAVQERKNRIEALLAGEPYFITVDAQDLASLDSICRTIMDYPAQDGWRLFVAACQKAGCWTPSAIAYVLTQFQVLH